MMTVSNVYFEILKLRTLYENTLYKNREDFNDIAKSVFSSSDYYRIADKDASIASDYMVQSLNIFKKKIKDLIKELEIYGMTDSNITYNIFIGDWKELKALLNSPLRDLIVRLKDEYMVIEDRLNTLNGDKDQLAYSVAREKRYSELVANKGCSDYSAGAIDMITACLISDIRTYISLKDTNEICTRINTEIAKILGETGLVNFDNIWDILIASGGALLFSLLDTDFTDIKQWPYQDNALELVQSKLQHWNLTLNTAKKMALMGVTDYNNTHLYEAVSIQCLKEIVDKAIENKNKWYFSRHTNYTVPESVMKHIEFNIPKRVIDRINIKALVRYEILLTFIKDGEEIDYIDQYVGDGKLFRSIIKSKLSLKKVSLSNFWLYKLLANKELYIDE